MFSVGAVALDAGVERVPVRRADKCFPRVRDYRPEGTECASSIDREWRSPVFPDFLAVWPIALSWSMIGLSGKKGVVLKLREFFSVTNGYLAGSSARARVAQLPGSSSAVREFFSAASSSRVLSEARELFSVGCGERSRRAGVLQRVSPEVFGSKGPYARMAIFADAKTAAQRGSSSAQINEKIGAGV